MFDSEEIFIILIWSVVVDVRHHIEAMTLLSSRVDKNKEEVRKTIIKGLESLFRLEYLVLDDGHIILEAKWRLLNFIFWSLEEFELEEAYVYSTLSSR